MHIGSEVAVDEPCSWRIAFRTKNRKCAVAPAWIRIRFERKVLTLKERVAIEVCRSVSRGEPIMNMQRKSKPVEPIASFTEEGELEWNEDLREENKGIRSLAFEGRWHQGHANDLTIT